MTISMQSSHKVAAISLESPVHSAGLLCIVVGSTISNPTPTMSAEEQAGAGRSYPQRILNSHKLRVICHDPDLYLQIAVLSTATAKVARAWRLLGVTSSQLHTRLHRPCFGLQPPRHTVYIIRDWSSAISNTIKHHSKHL